MNNTETLTKLKEIFTDLDKILDTANKGRVPAWYDANKDTVEWKDYTMSGDAHDDVYAVWMKVRQLILAMEGAN